MVRRRAGVDVERGDGKAAGLLQRRHRLQHELPGVSDLGRAPAAEWQAF